MQIHNSQAKQASKVLQNYNANDKGYITQSRTVVEIQNWLVSYLAELLFIKTDEIDITIPFDRYGLDSASVIGLTGDLERWLTIELEPTLIYDYPCVEALARHLAEQLKVEDSNNSQNDYSI